MPLPETTRLELEAMDAALAGDAVDPGYAELAELALMLADSRPVPPPETASALDRRFAALSRQPARAAVRRAWFLRPAPAAGLALALVLAVLVIVLPHGGSSSSSSSNGATDLGLNGAASSSGGSSAANSSSSSASGAAGASSGSASSIASSPVPAHATATVPTPRSNGRRIVQTARLSLGTPAGRLAAVAQELFDAVGAEQGIVKHSAVSTGAGAYASFTLSIPTPNLSATLARLTRLRYATVTSSTASTSDVNSQYLDDQRRLVDAKALRTSLLTQLQAATTTTAVDSLKTQIHDTEATIAADEATVNRLQGRISYSSVAVEISGGSAVVAPPPPADGGFTVHRALDDALDVLRVAAGVLLIVLAVLIPVGLLGALAAWLRLGWRRRRRERALDAA
jgi:hypothetical protein